MSKIYFYKLTVDDGGAPCVQDGVLSLAICKPMIRSMADVGNLIFGFAANSLHSDNRLIYVAKVTETSDNGDYYRAVRYARRPDRVYRWRGGGFEWRSGALYHGPKHLKHDLGKHPEYPRARVLLSSDFRYFGADGRADYKSRFSAVRRAVEGLGQGHRLHHHKNLAAELRALADSIWRSTVQGDVGKQSSSPRPNVSHRGRSCGVVAEGDTKAQ